MYLMLEILKHALRVQLKKDEDYKYITVHGHILLEFRLTNYNY